MEHIREGDTISITSFKHPDRFHRLWKKSIVLDAGDPLVIANEMAVVIDKDGAERIFPYCSICLFYQSEWFNIVMVYEVPSGIFQSYYCNLASPYQKDPRRKGITYIDYDLDLKIQPNGRYTLLDKDEFQKHQRIYHYPPQVLKQVESGVQRLLDWLHSGRHPFTSDFRQKWYHRYLSMKSTLE